MIDSIYVATSGLNEHQRGLRVISNNVANMNTPGFKGATQSFSDVLGEGYAGYGDAQGQGLSSGETLLDLRAGELRQTGRDLDLALQGNGFFVMQDEAGSLHYTRAGAFEFNADGVLVGRDHGLQVMGHDANGRLVPIQLDGLRLSLPRASSEIVLAGNLSSTDTEHSIEAVVVYDRLGGAHTLRLQFASSSATPGTWAITVFEGSRQVGTGTVAFENGVLAAGASPVALTLELEGVAEPAAMNLVLGSDVTGFSSGTTSSLAFRSQDGYTLGQITTLTFDERGVLKIAYGNGQTADGPKLVFAEMRDEAALRPEGESLFGYDGTEPPLIREAGDDLKVAGQTLELSNVDLTQQFSALILMQRGYQASSQVLSTANDMLQELFDMKGRR